MRTTAILLVMSAAFGQTPKPGIQARDGRSAVAEHLASLEREIEAAVVALNSEFLKKTVAEDFRFPTGDEWTSGGVPGRIFDRATWLAFLPTTGTVARDVDSQQVELHGDLAITTGRIAVKNQPSQKRDYSLWYIRLYRNRGDQWQLVSHRTVRHGELSGGAPAAAAAAAARQPVPPPRPERSDASREELAALDRRIESAALHGDFAFLDGATEESLRFTHGDAWTSGGKPLAVNDKVSYLKLFRDKPMLARDVDSQTVELHGNSAILTGRIQVRNDHTKADLKDHTIWYWRVFRRSDQGWRLVSHYTVRMIQE